MRITIDGQRIETTLSLSVDPKKWYKIAEKVIGKDRKSQEINSRLDTIKLRITEIYRDMELEDKRINPIIILDYYKGIRMMIVKACYQFLRIIMTDVGNLKIKTCLYPLLKGMKLVFVTPKSL